MNNLALRHSPMREHIHHIISSIIPYDDVEQEHIFVFSCHTPGFTPLVLSHLLQQHFRAPILAHEMVLEAEGVFSIPSGCVAKVEL